MIAGMSDPIPIACSLTPEGLAARRNGLIADLVRRAQAREVLSQGVRLTFNAEPGILRAIIEVIEAERQCCRFLRFDLSMAADDGPISLELSGPSGTREFLAALFCA